MSKTSCYRIANMRSHEKIFHRLAEFGGKPRGPRGEGKAVLVISQFLHNLPVSLNNKNTAKNLKLTQVEHACSAPTAGGPLLLGAAAAPQFRAKLIFYGGSAQRPILHASGGCALGILLDSATTQKNNIATSAAYCCLRRVHYL